MMERLDEFRGNVYRFGEAIPATYLGGPTSVVGVTDQRSSLEHETDLVVRMDHRDWVVPRNEVRLTEENRLRLKLHVQLASGTLILPKPLNPAATTTA